MSINGKRETRRAERRATMAPSTLRARGIAATDVTVVDLSESGVRLSSTVALAIGEEISIGLRGVGTRRAYVAWQRDDHYGCAFDCPLEPDEVQVAFAGASVVRLGTPAQVNRASMAGDNAELQMLYGTHSPWRMPLDAILALLGFALLFGWLSWHYLLG